MNEGQNGIFSGLANSDANNQSNFGLQTNNSANLQSGFASQANNGANTQPNFSSQPNSGVASQPNFAPQTPVVGPSSGDIIIGGKDSRKSYKWLLFLVLGVIIVVAIIIVAVLLNTKNLIGKTSNADLAELVSCIENGPDDETKTTTTENDTDNTENATENSETNNSANEEADEETDTEIADTIYAIRIKNNPRSVIETYYDELNKKAENVLSELPDETAMEYRSALKVLEHAINYKKVSEKAVEAAKAGLDNAKTYFEENFDCTDTTNGLATLCQIEARYYENVMGEYFLYAENGCYQNDSYNLECLNNISENLESSIESPNEALAKMSSSAVLKTLSSEIKTLNQKLLEGQSNV